MFFLRSLGWIAVLSLLAGCGNIFPPLPPSIAFSPDGRYILTSNGGYAPQLWEVETGQWVREFGRYQNDVSSIAFSPDGQMVAAGTQFGSIRLWNTETGEAIREFQTDTGTIMRLVFGPDAQYVISLGFSSYSASFWHIETGERVHLLGGYNDGMTDLALSPDGRYLLTVSLGTGGQLWEVETGQEIRRFNRVQRVGFSTDGHYALMATYGDSIRRWILDANGLAQSRTVTLEEALWAISFSPDGNYALMSSVNNMSERTQLSLRSFETGEPIRTVVQSTEGIREAIFSPDGRYVLTTSFNPSGDGSVWLWSVETGQPVRQISGPGAPAPCRTRILGICM
jgi:WD40 repeat protein